MTNWLGFRESDWSHVGNGVVKLYGPRTAIDFAVNGPQWTWRRSELYTWSYPALVNVESPGLGVYLRLLDSFGCHFGKPPCAEKICVPTNLSQVCKV